MKAILSVIMLLVLAGCGTFQNVTQLEEQTYLQLSGSVEDIVLTIDSQPEIIVASDAKSFDLNGETVTQFIIAPGQHIVKIERNGELLVHRKLYVAEGNSVEIKLP